LNKLNEQVIDINQLLRPFLRYWYLLLIGVVLAVATAYWYLRHATPTYQVKATVLIRNQQANGLTEEVLQKKMLGMHASSEVYEDVRLLKSKALMEAVVDSLQLHYQISHSPDRWQSIDQYSDHLIDWEKTQLPIGSYQLQILDTSTYELSIAERLVLRTQFGQKDTTTYGIIQLSLTKEATPQLGNYLINSYQKTDRANHYLSRLGVTYNEKEPTILDLYLEDEVPERGKHILSAVMETYNEMTLDDKSKHRRNTLQFIDERLELLERELTQAERDVEGYKNREQLALDSESKVPFLQDRLVYFEERLIDVDIQLNKLNYVANLLANNEYTFIPIVDLGEQNAGLTTLIDEYNTLAQQKKQLEQSVTAQFPAIQVLDQQLAQLSVSLQEEVTKNRASLVDTRAELTQKQKEYVAQLNATPRRERELGEQERQRVIKEKLYLYLLEKREEAAIATAALVENAKVIDAPYTTVQLSPKPASTYLGAFLGGLFLPGVLLLSFALFDRRLRDMEEVTQATDVPVLGTIIQSKNEQALLAETQHQSATAETFRSLRTNLELFVEPQVIVLTSSSTSEGKSFTCVNLGMSYALTNRKVVLVDFDLRRPQLANYLNRPDHKVGVAQHLAGTADYLDIVHTHPAHPCLHYIPCGTPPNYPAELLLHNRVRVLIEQLRADFELVILDSPAVGLVADSLLLSKYADASLYVTRIGVTYKKDLALVNELHAANKFNNMALVCNGLSSSRISKRAYQSGYYSK
jgi:capsular exopolysaccharide synthesis family protein